jgi:FemAB-related protein (PEP-CTERM system-associated)
MVTIERAGESSQAEWDAFVNAHADATGYHLWRWRRVFARAFGHRTEYLLARAGGVVQGVLPLVVAPGLCSRPTLVSLPFVNYGGVLAATPDAQAALLAAAVQRTASVRGKAIELRHRRGQFETLHQVQSRVGMTLPLAPAWGDAWRQLDRKVRNQVRKAQQAGLTVASGGRQHLDEFYSVFATNMRDLGSPVFPRRFFAEMLDAFPERTGIVVVRSGHRPIAAAITYGFRTTIEVPSASSLRQHRALCGNTLLYWSIIERAIADGYQALDFGRSAPDSGPYQFKRQWGAIPEPLCWEYWTEGEAPRPARNADGTAMQAAIAMWKRLPVGVATALGPRVARYFP